MTEHIMAVGSIFLAFVAGLFSVLSPCVLPIVPIVLGAAASKHRLGPVALAAGLSVSFTAVGLLVATVGHSLGIGIDAFRYVAAILIVALGIVLVLPALQTRLAVAGGPIAAWTDRHFDESRGDGLSGQFWVGVLLGALWSPCVGPTLGAASLLAAQGRDLSTVAITMFAFGIGAALPLLTLGLLSREAMMRWRSQLRTVSDWAKVILGALFITVGLLVLLGLDRTVETVLVDASPQWITVLTTRF